MNRLIVLSMCVLSLAAEAAGLPPVFGPEAESRSRRSPLTSVYLAPQRIVWQAEGGGLVKDAEALLAPGRGQSDLSAGRACTLSATAEGGGAVVLDFGREIQGGVQLVTGKSAGKKPVRLRLRFGESVSEAMSDVGGPKGATNDHAMRDYIVEAPALATLETGGTGFRFLRIDVVDAGETVALREASAVLRYRDVPYVGAFECNDARLNQIWLTGAYTVHLTMQEYLWDGIKRDRLVWVGDMHPEVMTILAVFGANEVVPRSLDYIRDITPLPGWMNGISSYSLWWIIIQRDWFRYTGDRDYLRRQQGYLTALLGQVMGRVDAQGREHLDGWRFLDWPSSTNRPAVDAGLQALTVMALRAGRELCLELKEEDVAARCDEVASRMQARPHGGSKQAAALMALADLFPAGKANTDVISVGGVKGFSTYYGYYMLEAQARAGDYQAALDGIRRYWGGMLDMGATTFWEDFDIDWMKDAARIDELVPPGKRDIHGDYGAWCYKNLRHSLCHGWASGPAAWLTGHVLGVKVLEPGCKVVRIEPHLADLEWVRGVFPTPYGPLHIEHRRQPDGSVKTEVSGPPEVTVVR
jgi:hypothetical protein